MSGSGLAGFCTSCLGTLYRHPGENPTGCTCLPSSGHPTPVQGIHACRPPCTIHTVIPAFRRDDGIVFPSGELRVLGGAKADERLAEGLAGASVTARARRLTRLPRRNRQVITLSAHMDGARAAFLRLHAHILTLS